MDMNTVDVAITVTVNGQKITKKASGGSADNPYRLAEGITQSVHAEIGKALSDPRFKWDQQQKRDR
ncbi:MULTISPECIES: hypothetical protein [unclassified Micromonospora]|uniref:hypothetical protein n=1 Tax=unclassified Micromonospora TaxID=2617518 RepID=UPI0034100D6E